MNYFLMAVAILFAAANSLILRQFKSRTFKTAGDIFFFNGAVSLVWVGVMTLWAMRSDSFEISLGAVLFGLLYGIILCLFLYFKTESFANGPVSLTTLIGSCAFIIATAFGVVYNSETIRLNQGIGMTLILLSLVFCINPKKSAEKLSAKWFVFCFLFFLAGGFLGIFYKIFGTSDAATQVNSMMLCASIFSCILFFAAGLLVNKANRQPLPSIDKKALVYILSSGIAGCIYIRLNIDLSKVIPSAVFFPVSNGALVIISTVAGGLLFKEKLNKMQIFGIFMGLAAIVINGL